MAESYSLSRVGCKPNNIPESAMVADVDGEAVYVWPSAGNNKPEQHVFYAARKDYINVQESEVGMGDTENEAIVDLLENEQVNSALDSPETAEDSSDSKKVASEDNGEGGTEASPAEGSTCNSNWGKPDADIAEVHPDDCECEACFGSTEHQYDPECTCIKCVATKKYESDQVDYTSCDADHRNCPNDCKAWKQIAAGKRVLQSKKK